MKGKIIIIIIALMLVTGVFVLADKANITSAFSQKNTKNQVNSIQNQDNVHISKENGADEKNTIKPITITEKNIKNCDEIIDVDMKIPVINGLQNIDVQNKINSKLEKDATSFQKENMKNAKKDSDDFKSQGMKFRKYEAVSQYTLQYNKNGYLSLTVDYYMYTGGAHGMTDRVAYNYDLKTGEELKFSDLFQNDFNYKEFTNNNISKQINANKGMYFEGEEGFKTISDTQPFYITEGNIVVYFSLYEIAAYAAGFPEFKIPFSDIKDNLKVKF